MAERLVPRKGGCSYRFSRPHNHAYRVDEWTPYLVALAFNLNWAYEAEKKGGQFVLYSEEPMPEVISNCL